MLSSVLRSRRAVQVNIAIMRAFIRMRRLLASDPDLARRVERLESQEAVQDEKISELFDVIVPTEAPAGRRKKRIGFKTEEGSSHRAD